MDFDIYEQNEMIHIKAEHSIFPLFPESGLAVIDKVLYALKNEQLGYFNVVKNALASHNNDIVIEKSFKHNFASSILPTLQKVGTVSLGPIINQTLYTDALVTEVYLDQFQNTVKGNITFNYGEYKLFVPPKDDHSIPEEIMIIQDLQKESEIINLLKASNCIFNAEDGYFTFGDDAFLYDFIYLTLPKLQELATIYYSDSFKNIHIDHHHAFTGHIGMTSKGLLDFTFEIEGIEDDEIFNIIDAMHSDNRYFRLRSGQFLSLEENHFTGMDRILDELDLYDQAMESRILKLPISKAFALEQLLSKTQYKSFHKGKSFRQLLSDIKNPLDIDTLIPDGLLGNLRSYQETGFKWLAALNTYGLGGILADDMGLGKTIQTITLLLTNKTGRPSIVIAPTSLIYNWAAEFDRFAPSLKYHIITGDKDRREQLILNELSNFDIIISSYGTAKRDIEHYRKVEFEYCILDEAQHIKNHLSMNALAVKMLRAKTKLALTGTPIENNISELWSIFDFVMPGFLHDHKTFFSLYERPIVKEGSNKQLKQLLKQISPFILRRLKKDVLLELPAKIETTMYTGLSNNQKALYLAVLEQTKSNLRNSDGGNKTMQIFAALTKLRQICCHPSLVDPNLGAESNKMETLNEIVHDALEGGHRLLIFSTFTSMLQIIRGHFDEQGIKYFYLDGKTKAEERLNISNKFNEGENEVCLISLKAGGTGLNLTGADMVIHYDPWWNLAAEDQATDRAYRIGQNKSVQVIKLLTTGTIEEKIFKLQAQKKSLIDSVIQPGETFINHLSENELLKLFDD